MPTAIIIDDSPIMRAQLRGILESNGFTVAAEAGNANSLAALYEQHRPDVIALDIVMPGRDGVTAASELLRTYPEAVIVICSSLASRQRISACKEAGVYHYLLKPIDAGQAAHVFKSAAARAQPSGGS